MANVKEVMERRRKERQERQAARSNRGRFFRPERNEDGSKCTSRVRILPYVHEEDEFPFQEIHTCYDLGRIVGEFNLVEPFATYGEENPLQEFLGDMRRANFDLYKEYRPNNNFYVPVLVRDEEDDGVQWWRLSYSQYMKIEALVIDNVDWSDEDLFDRKTGFDFQVVTKHNEQGKKYNGKTVYDTDISPIRKWQGPILTKGRGKSADTEAISTLLDSMQTIQEVFPVKSDEELEKIVATLREKLLETGGEEGSSRGGGDTTSSREKELDEAVVEDGTSVTDEFDTLMG